MEGENELYNPSMSVDQAKLLSLVNEILNEQAKLRKGVEAVYECPFCHHYKPKLEINISSQKWHCWVCNAAGMSFRSLFRKLKVARTYYVRLYDITKDRKLQFDVPAEEKQENLKLPDTFIPLSGIKHSPKRISPHRLHALKYLLNRGINEIDILRYNIGYVEDGEYAGRVIIPSYDSHGNVNFFSSRSFYDIPTMKYKNPNWSKNIIGFEIFINWDEPITLVEGAFDAIAVRRNAVPLFGKTISFVLKEALIRNGVERVNIVLDNDAKSDALDIQDFLNSQEIDSYLVRLDGKDPSEIGFERITQLIENTKPTDFHNLVAMKLFE